MCIRTDKADLEAVDKRVCQYLDAIANNGKSSAKLSAEDFNAYHDPCFVADFIFDTKSYIFETFSTQSSDGSLVELKPGGKSVPVTYVQL